MRWRVQHNHYLVIAGHNDFDHHDYLDLYSDYHSNLHHHCHPDLWYNFYADPYQHSNCRRTQYFHNDHLRTDHLHYDPHPAIDINNDRSPAHDLYDNRDRHIDDKQDPDDSHDGDCLCHPSEDRSEDSYEHLYSTGDDNFD